jgi:hypothetical protein
MKKVVAIVSIALSMVLTHPAFAEDQAAPQELTKENAQILLAKIRADKKFITSQNMQLTDDEAKVFWPLYDEYQDGLANINRRLANLIVTYGEAYTTKSLTDDKAEALLKEMLSIDADDLALKQKMMPKLVKALPAIKAARYMQIENKLHAIIRMKLADAIPLAQ